MPRQAKTYNLNRIAGLVATWKNKVTGAQISVYHGLQSGYDADPETPWVTICEDHGDTCSHGSLRLAKAHAAIPEWCSTCAKVIHGDPPGDPDEDDNT
jgi:hypothetical protein